MHKTMVAEGGMICMKITKIFTAWLPVDLEIVL